MQIRLANPRGFCAGVDRAIEIVNRALEVFGAPIYVRHEVVHNKFVVDDLRARGAVFVDELDEVPDGVIVIFSAHGVSQAVQQEAARRALKVFDATCPLVTKVHMEVTRYSRQGRECILIGHAGHPEVEGTMGQYDTANGGAIYLVESAEQVATLQVRHPEALSYVTQTTLSVDDTTNVIEALRARFPAISGPRRDDICYATQNRQDAVKQLAADCDLVLVVGSPNSSNSNRLAELAQRMGAQAHLIDTAEDIRAEWLDGKSVVGVTAGASAPEILVRRVVERLQELGATAPEEMAGRVETITFSMPRELRVDPAPVGPAPVGPAPVGPASAGHFKTRGQGPPEGGPTAAQIACRMRHHAAVAASPSSSRYRGRHPVAAVNDDESTSSVPTSRATCARLPRTHPPSSSSQTGTAGSRAATPSASPHALASSGTATLSASATKCTPDGGTGASSAASIASTRLPT
jgi:4-hydroxy-3-methylbut-2-en-1-yl diphosphate reductase